MMESPINKALSGEEGEYVVKFKCGDLLMFSSMRECLDGWVNLFDVKDLQGFSINILSVRVDEILWMFEGTSEEEEK